VAVSEVVGVSAFIGVGRGGIEPRGISRRRPHHLSYRPGNGGIEGRRVARAIADRAACLPLYTSPREREEKRREEKRREEKRREEKREEKRRVYAVSAYPCYA